jgi:hypothetical protein
MKLLRITVGGAFVYTARMEQADAPQTCAAFERLLPYRQKIIHARWSGEACWIPLGEFQLGVGFENHTSHPAPGDVIIYTGGLSECEILIAYGGVAFSSKVGQLAGNHFASINGDREQLREMGRRVLWEGAQEIVIEEVA